MARSRRLSSNVARLHREIRHEVTQEEAILQQQEEAMKKVKRKPIPVCTLRWERIWVSHRESVSHDSTIPQVQVQIPTGRRFQILLDKDDTVEDMKTKIYTKEGVNPDVQEILFNGNFVSIGVTVAELRIDEEAVLFLILRNRGG